MTVRRQLSQSDWNVDFWLITFVLIWPNSVQLSQTADTTARGISILGEVRNVAISRVTQQLLWYKFHDFLAGFALAQSKINQIA